MRWAAGIVRPNEQVPRNSDFQEITVPCGLYLLILGHKPPGHECTTTTVLPRPMTVRKYTTDA
jgi:hypothetical protein